MSGFALLWGKTLDSSLWVTESKETRLLWMTMLMMKNSEGVIQASVVGLADRAKITVNECRESLLVLLSPDPNDTSKIEEGRRVREVPGGWQIVNHDLYRFSTEAKREFWKATKAEERAKKPVHPKPRVKRSGNGKPLPGEAQTLAALRRGDFEGAAAIAEAALPEHQPLRSEPSSPASESLSRSSASLKENGGLQDGEAPVESGRYVDGEWVPD